MSHFLKTFIVGSVLLNLLLAGVVLGNAGRYFVKQPKGYTWQEIGEALPADTQPKFEKTIAQAVQETDKMRHQLSEERKKYLKLLAADPFDKAACLAQMQQMKQLRLQIMQRMIDSTAEFAEQVSPEARATMAEMLRYPPRHTQQEE